MSSFVAILHIIVPGWGRSRRWIGFPAARKSEEESANFGSEDHVDWMRRSSRMLDEDGRAGCGVGRRVLWSGAEHAGQRLVVAGLSAMRG